MSKLDYQAAGVNIAEGNKAVSKIKAAVESTFTPHVLTQIGSFGAMYDLAPLMQEYQHPVLVQSIDGVGTKMMIAKMMQKFDTIGIDLVSATTNDIIVLGAKPLTLLDYIANDKLDAQIVEQIIAGMAHACKQNGIALVGGEIAEMPGTYLPGEHDLVGIITGVVEKEAAILGKGITPGDQVLAFSSSGLHTNGYSLARKIFFAENNYAIDHYFPELGETLGESLLKPHINYTQPIQKLLKAGVHIKGMAHITGGGVLENIPRILPPSCSVTINKNSAPVLPIFKLMQRLANVETNEMYRTFNMGIGLIMVVAASQVALIHNTLENYTDANLYNIGEVVSGKQEVILK